LNLFRNRIDVSYVFSFALFARVTST